MALTPEEQAELAAIEAQIATIRGRAMESLGVATPEAPRPLERFGKGMADVASGAVQLAADVLSPLPMMDRTIGSIASDITRKGTENRRLYEAGKEAGGLTGLLGIDPYEAMGAGAATAPLFGAAGPASLYGRAALGAAQGAAEGALTFVPEGGSRAANIGVGAVTGGAVPLGLAGAAKGGSATLNATANLLRRSPPIDATVEAQVLGSLAAQGVDFSALDDDARARLAQAVANATGTPSQLTPKQAQFLADALAAAPDAPPTLGQVTRDPSQWEWEYANRNLPGAEGLKTRFSDQVRQMSETLTNLPERLNIGSRVQPSVREDTGRQMISDLQQADARAKRLVTEAYDVAHAAADALPGGGGAVEADKVLQSIYARLDQELARSDLPADVEREIRRAAKERGNALSISDLEQLAKRVNRRIDNLGKDQNGLKHSLSVVKGVLRQTQEDMAELLAQSGDPAGKEATRLFREARKLAQERFERMDGSKVLREALDDPDPTKMAGYVTSSTPQELRRMIDAMSDLRGPSVGPRQLPYSVDAMQQQVLDHISQKVRTSGLGASGETGMSSRALTKELDRIGDEKLRILFGDSATRELRQIARGMQVLIEQPPTATPNRSGTAAQMLRFFNERMAGGGMIGRFLQALLKQAEGVRVNIRVGRALEMRPEGADIIPRDVRVRALQSPRAQGLAPGAAILTTSPEADNQRR